MAAGRAGSCTQGHHGKLPAEPHTCTGPPPTFHGTSSQADLLAMSLTCFIVILQANKFWSFLTHILFSPIVAVFLAK